MLKRLASAAAITASLSLLTVTPAFAASCGLLNLLCSPPPAPAVTAPVAPPAEPASPTAPATDPAPATAAQPAEAVGAGDVPDAAATLLTLVNQERARAGLGALESRPAIVAIAARQSQAMAERGDIWHNDAYFKPAIHAALAARALGENVAVNGSVEVAHLRLMASPGHRANILNGRFDAVGIAVVRDGRGAVFITEDFVDSRVAPKAKAPRRAPARRPASRRPRRAASR